MSFDGLTTHSVYQPFMDPTDEKVLQMTIPLFTASPQISIPTPDASTRASSPRMPTPELTSAFEDAYSSSLDYVNYEIDEITTTATMHDDDATQKMTPQQEEFMEEILSSSSSSSQWPIVDTQGTVIADVCNRCGLQWVEGDKCLICDGGDSVCLDWTLSDDANLTVPSSSMMAAEEIEELASYNHLEDAFNAYEEQRRYEEEQQQQHLLLLQDNAVDESSATETSPDEDDVRSPLARESYFDGLRIKAPI